MTKQPDVFAAIAESLERIATAIEEVAEVLTTPTVTAEPEPAPFAVGDRVHNTMGTLTGTVVGVSDTRAKVHWDPGSPWKNITRSWDPFENLEKVLDSSPD